MSHGTAVLARICAISLGIPRTDILCLEGEVNLSACVMFATTHLDIRRHDDVDFDNTGFGSHQGKEIFSHPKCLH
jgi:hypothetical protein